MSDWDDCCSDHGSDFSDWEDDYIKQNDVEGTAEPEDENIRIAAADPEVGHDEELSESDVEYETDEEIVAKDDEDEEAVAEDEEAVAEDEDVVDDDIDLKAVSTYNKEIIVVKPEERITSHILSRYEMTEIVSIRATQISQYNNCMVPIDGLDDPVKQAKRELMARMCPLILTREVGELKNKDTGDWQSFVEEWYPNTMTFAIIYTDI